MACFRQDWTKQTLEGGQHPYGVQPEGNMYFDDTGGACRRDGLGLLAALSDDQLIDVLSELGHKELCALAQV